MTVFWVAASCRLVQKLTNVSKVLAASIALMTQATSISETSVNVYQTTGRNNPEDGHLQEPITTWEMSQDTRALNIQQVVCFMAHTM
jgi:hypothetical protein